ncbi:conserved protein of unknown function [Petrocella atlantisensis]|uniref:RAP domain-containing protein n=1 Tax=Petrocella atlantisensis TaxID=2173034 RepID=A0A3P7NYF1_9FIRM|nr:DUF3320 domain-containing protein [Petrocella atlantisensis]VDN48244.1 conserved protein of unknown function [Petrocella atlantisensis]
MLNTKIEKNIDNWKKSLLELGKRNKLISYKETKRSNINIIEPGISKLFEDIVLKEKEMIFPNPVDEDEQQFISGNIRSDRTLSEEQKTLRNIRNKAKSFIQEQGINVLYMAFGFLEWKELQHSDIVLKSPLVLVPVSLRVDSITDPYVLQLHEDEIVLNPTLAFKLNEDFGISLPEFDSDNEDIIGYLNSIESVIGNSSWKVTHDTSISLLSFMKMNMYNDIENNVERIKAHPVLNALAGDSSDIKRISEDFDGFDHDTKVRPIDTFQVVDADSSQQDAILYSKNNISFILQGPPGTGKSQTITNIISEGLSDGKKILFVSEKSAALEVVHSRLSNVGLAEFCMSLHNNKKNKKEVLNDLNRTFNLDKRALKDDALYDLQKLEEERDLLNQYVKDLHIKNDPLNKSIFEITGELAALPACKDLQFTIDNVKSMTLEDLNKIKIALDDFSHVLGMMKKDYKDNPWIGCNLKSVTHEFRLNTEIDLKKLQEGLDKINNALMSFNSDMGVNWEMTLDEIDEYINFLHYVSTPPVEIPEQWLEGDLKIIVDASQKAKDYKHTLEDYHGITDNLMMKYKEEFFDVDGKTFYEDILRFESQLSEIGKIENIDIDELIDRADYYINKSDELQESLSCVNELAVGISKEFGLNNIRNYDDLKYISNFLLELYKKPNPTEMWFDDDQNRIVDELLQESMEKRQKIITIRETLNTNFENDVLTLDYKEMLLRFRTNYTGFLKIFKKQYKMDKSAIRGYYKSTDKLTDQIIIDALQLITEYHNHEDWFNQKENILTKAFGMKYMNEYTDWDAIKNARSDFDELKKLIGKSILNKATKELLCNGEYPDKLEKVEEQINDYLSSAQWTNIMDLINYDTINKRGIRYVPTALRTFRDILIEARKAVDLFDNYTISMVKFSVLKNDLQKKLRLEEIEMNLNKNYQSLKEVFSELFTGTETDWDRIIQALEWTEQFTRYKNRFEVSKEFIEKFQNTSYSNDLLEVLTKEKVTALQKWEGFKSLFDEGRGMLNANSVELLLIVSNCISGFKLLEEWVDYRSHRKACKEMGLGEYIEKAEEAGMLKTHLRNGYLRRFYKLWLDINIAKYPSVLNFRQRVQFERIENFRELDKRSLEIARARVRSKLIDSLPNRNFTSSAGDEVSILNREMSKRRRIMPLRRLFASIPNLLMTLKPCMMMSPLSVSLFLQAESYDFDMVIFDEASQVKTEDAVGAIMRGKTVVICGDDKQLPPTSFFGTSKMNDDYDSEEEEIDSYESILDEGLTVLPNRTLKWHYRSRHEHLIAFSNAKIYNNELVTFPSCKDDVPHEGVEYIHVSDGLYDRGGSRSNVIEAKKVAQLVIEHFVRHPNRSLGVVTFSTAQQTAVENELRTIRLNDNSYESFFNEDKAEAFFVKNIETVQGDERDTIMFSIGYAKDGTGKPMAMNFGPLTKDGGERRLNVAITRAKHNVKLVGSIHPTDIDLDRTSSEGVHLLRSYIEFAKNGPSVLEREATADSVKEFDSPFERSVYDFLMKKGHKVDTQVGCSGYKIDLGVKHPEISGVYIMGIECDGATYHSTRTARERDRIRQTVLEDMGWKFHRIWSTDYIKDPKNENNKLLEAIEECIDNFNLEQEVQIDIPTKVDDDIHEKLLVEVEATTETEHQDIDKYGFEFYKTVDYNSLNYYCDDVRELSKEIKTVVEIESPIHFELLCRRIAPLTGREKVTKVVRDLVNSALPYCKESVDYKYDFLWRKNEILPKVRIPETTYDIRDITHISPEEIAEAMMTIVLNSYGITKEGLYAETRRVFGYNRAGQKIIKAMDEVYNRLIVEDKVKVLDDRITLV